ncbi:MAG: hypothetical protein ACHBN1_08095 [Heteroscytonema crispum UTEX LB 1556]
MTHQIHESETFHLIQPQIDLELLEALLEPEDNTYPWNPTDEESEAYYQELEQQFLTSDVLDEELTIRSQSFYDQLDTLWSECSPGTCYKDTTESSVAVNLQKTLQAHLALAIPQGLLKAIAQKATEIFSTQQTMGEQMIQCVQAVLPAWAAEDLFVLARPYAYAMRSSEPQNLETVLGKVDNRDWNTLSEIEQAKVSLAIAYYALSELNSFQGEP